MAVRIWFSDSIDPSLTSADLHGLFRDSGASKLRARETQGRFSGLMAEWNGRVPQWMTVEAAAAYCCISLSDYVALSRQGVLPAPFQPGLTLIDREALDLALDRLGCGLEIEPLPPMAVTAPRHAARNQQEPSDPVSTPKGRSLFDPEPWNVWLLALISLLVIARFLEYLP